MIPHHHFSESGAHQMRFQRLISAVILACAVSACAKDVTGVTRTLPPLAYVRYIDAVADTFDMDFRAVDQVAYSQPFLNVAYKGLGDGNFQGYQAGSRHIRIFLDPSPPNTSTAVSTAVVSTVMIDTTMTLVAGSYYTIIHVGNARTGAAVKEHLWVVTDASMPAQTAGIQYRVYNAAPVQGAVDVFVGPDGVTPLVAGAATDKALAFGSFAAYASLATGPMVIRLTTPGTTVAVGAAGGYTVQVGTAGTTSADPIYGSGQAGSIFSAYIFDATPVGSVQATASATPSVVYYPDVQPPRTTSP
jgi:hypothetical protein